MLVLTNGHSTTRKQAAKLVGNDEMKSWFKLEDKFNQVEDLS